MSFRWITEEDWLRAADAPEHSSHVPAERSSATVGVQPPSPQGELRGAVEGTRKRFRIVTAALTFGGLGLILATMIYAYEVVDQRALQAFKAPARTTQPETATQTVGSAAANPAESDAMRASQQTPTGQATPMPDPILNTQPNVLRKAHHGSKTHGKRFARAQHSQSFGPDPGQSLMEYVMFGNRKKASGQ